MTLAPRRISCLSWLALGIVLTPTVASAANPQEFRVWPAMAPGEKGDIGPERVLPDEPNRRIVIRRTDISEPSLTVFPAPAANNTGTTVLVCPGGGYHILAWDLEGTEVAEWLNSIGVTAVVLKYRVPRREGRPKHEAPLQDAQRAMRLVRARCGEWHGAADRIGILGFSAGGHLAAATSTNAERPSYDPIDSTDELSCRPDFTVLIYPAYLVDAEPLSEEIAVTAKSPPAFLAHAADDGLTPENSIRYFLALRQHNIPAELHVYSSGGHGFGLRPSEHPSSTWPDRCAAWLRYHHLIPGTETKPPGDAQ